MVFLLTNTVLNFHCNWTRLRDCTKTLKCQILSTYIYCKFTIIMSCFTHQEVLQFFFHIERCLFDNFFSPTLLGNISLKWTMRGVLSWKLSLTDKPSSDRAFFPCIGNSIYGKRWVLNFNSCLQGWCNDIHSFSCYYMKSKYPPYYKSNN